MTSVQALDWQINYDDVVQIRKITELSYELLFLEREIADYKAKKEKYEDTISEPILSGNYCIYGEGFSYIDDKDENKLLEMCDNKINNLEEQIKNLNNSYEQISKDIEIAKKLLKDNLGERVNLDSKY